MPLLAGPSGCRPNEGTCIESDISRLHVLAALSGCRPNEGTCIESDNANVTSDADPTTNVNETDSDDQEDNIISLALKMK